MSNTEWYAQLEAQLESSGFQDYRTQVNKAVKFSQGPSPEPTEATLQLLNLDDLDSIALEAQQLWEALPPSLHKPRAPRRHCHGLPRNYPKMWMATPHSNSLMFEFKEVRRLPSNGLKNWKE